MRGFIKYIGIIDKEQKQHFVSFKTGLNIITGKSSTGKSAILEIFDYCFGNEDHTVPEGIITENAAIYFTIICIKDSFLTLGRQPNSAKAFIKEEIDNNFIEKIENLNSEYFKDFIPLKDFKIELSRYFGIQITDTDTDLEDRKYRFSNKKKERPTARHFTSFMLQHQNLIANKHSLFYRFDEKEKREQTIDQFKIFTGFVDQEYFIKKQELSELERTLKSLNAKKERSEHYDLEIDIKIIDLLDKFAATAGYKLVEDQNVNHFLLTPNESYTFITNTEIKIETESNINFEIRKSLLNEQNKLAAEKRQLQNKLNNIQSSIETLEEYKTKNKEIETINKINIKVSHCPFCEQNNENIESEANKLSDAINWLNSELKKSSYTTDSLKVDENTTKKNIDETSQKLNAVTRQIKDIDKVIEQLSQNRSLEEQAIKTKFKIEALLEEKLQSKEQDIDQNILITEEKIKSLKNLIKEKYNYESERYRAEKKINERMNIIGKDLDFEPYYQPINLKFSLETFELHHQKGDKKIYLRSMGSGANWLYTHLCLFTSLQYYFCTLGDKCLIPPILFIDQPSQVYFPSSVDHNTEFNASDLKKKTTNKSTSEENLKKKADEDLQSVTKMFDQLIRHCKDTLNDTGIEPQIIITDHADNLTLTSDITFEELVAGRRWRTRGFIH